MFCEKCGNEFKENHKFCIECGRANLNIQESKLTIANILEKKWWFRLSKVVYIIIYSFILIIVPLVWSANNSEYIGYPSRYKDTYGKAFWYSLLALLIYIIILRLIKITFFYIAFAQKPRWSKEFKKLF